MLKPRALLLAMAGLCFVAAPAAAEDGRIAAGITAGTLGIGPEIGYRFNRTLGARANATFLGFSFDVDTTDVDYDVDVDLQSAGLMLDIFPTGSGFRISVGGRYNGSTGDADGTPQDRVRINGFVFQPAEIGQIRGDFTLDAFAPALTIGYGGTIRPGFVFSVEAGALFQGKIHVGRLRFEEGTASEEIVAMPVVQARLASEREELQDELDQYQVYPILQFGLGWRF